MKIPEGLLIKFLENNFEIKKTNSEELRICSPFAEDRKYHVYIDPKKSLYIDYKDHSSDNAGSMEKFIAKYLDIPINQVVVTLIKEYGYSLNDKISFVDNLVVDKKSEYSKIIDNYLKDKTFVFFSDENHIGTFGKKVLEYVRNRKITEKYIKSMGYVYNVSSPFDKRLIIPFFEDGYFSYFVARDVTGKAKLRYINPEKIDTKEFVLNIDDINEEVVICEGALDALSLNESQIGTSMMSGDLGVKQIMKIVNKTPNKIIYVPDQDATGLAKMEKNINNLFYYYPSSVNLDVFVYDLPSGIKDLNELKMKTGKDFIDYSECRRYSKKIVKPLEIKKPSLAF